MSSAWTRRGVLRGLLGGGLSRLDFPGLSPLVTGFHGLGRRREGFPNRFGLFMWGNGVLPENGFPKPLATTMN